VFAFNVALTGEKTFRTTHLHPVSFQHETTFCFDWSRTHQLPRSSCCPHSMPYMGPHRTSQTATIAGQKFSRFTTDVRFSIITNNHKSVKTRGCHGAGMKTTQGLVFIPVLTRRSKNREKHRFEQLEYACYHVITLRKGCPTVFRVGCRPVATF